MAEKAAVSKDLIAKLEQNQRQTASMASLQSLAHALDVTPGKLLDQPTMLARLHNGGMEAIRAALTSTADWPGVDREPSSASDGLDLASLRSGVGDVVLAYQRGEYSDIAPVVPKLVAEAELAAHDAREADRESAYATLAWMYRTSACIANQLGQEDLAYIATRKLVDTAPAAGDPLFESVGLWLAAWIVLRQGRPADAFAIASSAADRTEPNLSSASCQELSVWGMLLLIGMTAACREGKGDTARDYLSLAQTAATRVGADRNDYYTGFGPSTVAMHAVNLEMELAEPARALTAASTVPGNPDVPATAYTRYLLDLAHAQAEGGQDTEALQTLLGVEHRAPEWLRYQVLGREVVRELVERRRRVPERLRDLASRLAGDE